jgi:hypothetical protein
MFRSKSEAIFARCLDLAKCNWIYEPTKDQIGHRSDIHTFLECHEWDFYVRSDNWPYAKYFLVEYKPSPPTFTYVNNLIDKCYQAYLQKFEGFIDFTSSLKDKQKVKAALLNLWKLQSPSCILVWGSPWSPSSNIWSDCRGIYAGFPIFDPNGEFGLDFSQAADNGAWHLVPFSHRHDPESLFGMTREIQEKSIEYRFDLIDHE